MLSRVEINPPPEQEFKMEAVSNLYFRIREKDVMVREVCKWMRIQNIHEVPAYLKALLET